MVASALVEEADEFEKTVVATGARRRSDALALGHRGRGRQRSRGGGRRFQF